jgi:hypothetical protein
MSPEPLQSVGLAFGSSGAMRVRGLERLLLNKPNAKLVRRQGQSSLQLSGKH